MTSLVLRVSLGGGNCLASVDRYAHLPFVIIIKLLPKKIITILRVGDVTQNIFFRDFGLALYRGGRKFIQSFIFIALIIWKVSRVRMDMAKL